MNKRTILFIVFVVTGVLIVNYCGVGILDMRKNWNGRRILKQNERLNLNCSCINRTIRGFPNITANRRNVSKTFGIPKEYFDASSHHEVLDSYRIRKQPSGRCTQGQAVNYLVLVLGAIYNFDVRKSIRETWGNISRIENRTLDLVFVIGKEKGVGNHTGAIYNESQKYNDILELDFIDSYTNLTIKTILALRWVLTDCPQAKFVVRNMDDCFLDVFKLDKEMLKFKDNDIFLGCEYHASPVTHEGKYAYISEVPLVGNPKYHPPFILGFSIVLSVDVIQKFYYLSCVVPLLWPDDCHLGYLALLVNVTVLPNNEFCKKIIKHKFLDRDTPKTIRNEWRKRYKQ